MAETDLSAYKVEFTQNLLTRVWTWSMTDSDGTHSHGGSFLTLEAAEDDALYWMVRAATQAPPMNGEDLKQRFAARRKPAGVRAA